MTYYCIEEIHNAGTHLVIVEFDGEPGPETYDQIKDSIVVNDDLDLERDSLTIVPDDDVTRLDLTGAVA